MNFEFERANSLSRVRCHVVPCHVPSHKFCEQATQRQVSDASAKQRGDGKATSSSSGGSDAEEQADCETRGEPRGEEEASRTAEMRR